MNKPYLCSLHYYATGEGDTIAIGLLLQPTPEQATRAFLERHMGCSDESSLQYFGQGVGVLDLSDPAAIPQAREWLLTILKENVVDEIVRAENSHALFELYYKLYVNYS